MANINDKLATFIRVIEYELSFTYTMYFICIELTSFHIFSSICSIGLLVLTVFLVGVQTLPETIVKDGEEVPNEKRKWFIILFKVMNVGLCFMAFFMLFSSDMSLDIATDIEDYIGYVPKAGVYPYYPPGPNYNPSARPPKPTVSNASASG